MQRFYETNRLNFKGDAIGPFDRLNECIRTYLLGNGENEKRFLEGLPTVMFFQLGFQEPMILCVTRRDFIDHTPRDAAYTTDSRWSGPAATKICNTVWDIMDRLKVDKDSNELSKFGLTTPDRKRRQHEGAFRNMLAESEARDNHLNQQLGVNAPPPQPPLYLT